MQWYEKTIFVFIFFRGDIAVMETLLLHGAMVNSKDKRWLTPLHIACSSSNYNIVEILLKYKADANARDRNWQTPLHIAAANNSLQCVDLLIPHSLNINITDRFVFSVVFLVCYINHVTIVQ
jgi:ankyrin repeat protein